MKSSMSWDFTNGDQARMIEKDGTTFCEPFTRSGSLLTEWEKALVAQASKSWKREHLMTCKMIELT